MGTDKDHETIDIVRLHKTNEECLAAIESYRQKGGKDYFFIYPLVSQQDKRDACYLLNRENIFFYVLPCSVADKVLDISGKHFLEEEKKVVAQELKLRGSDRTVTEWSLFVKSQDESLLQIGVMEPICFIPTARKALPFVGGKALPPGTRLIK